MKFLKTILAVLLSLITLIFTSCKQGDNQSAQPGKTDSTQENNLYTKYKLQNIKLPTGFKIEVYAEVPGARSMTLSPSGTLFVGTIKSKVFAVTQDTNSRKAGKVYEIANGLNAPNGVAFKDGSLYIAATSTLYKMDNIEANLTNPSKPVIVYDKYPPESHHGNRFIAFGPDGKLYVAIGAPCNICEPKKPDYASITRINPDGTGYEIYASGIRNTVGFDWQPQTNNLWFTDNGRDNLGDDIPNDELNMASKAGMNFGYPYCHQGTILDEEFGKGKSCADYTAPEQLMGPHVAALGMRFNKNNKFPAEYSNAVFIAQHGSWNRSTPIGYRLMVVKFAADGTSLKPEIFAEGWLQKVRDVAGRPVDIQFLKDGSMLVSDDYAGAIYRIYYGQ
ncbi:MAG: PQQ-dependent sugar dehydrogenase [Ginsengibacter sp.]